MEQGCQYIRKQSKIQGEEMTKREFICRAAIALRTTPYKHSVDKNNSLLVQTMNAKQAVKEALYITEELETTVPEIWTGTHEEED